MFSKHEIFKKNNSKFRKINSERKVVHFVAAWK